MKRWTLNTVHQTHASISILPRKSIFECLQTGRMAVWCLRRDGETYTDLLLVRPRERNGKGGHDVLFCGKLEPSVPNLNVMFFLFFLGGGAGGDPETLCTLLSLQWVCIQRWSQPLGAKAGDIGRGCHQKTPAGFAHWRILGLQWYQTIILIVDSLGLLPPPTSMVNTFNDSWVWLWLYKWLYSRFTSPGLVPKWSQIHCHCSQETDLTQTVDGKDFAIIQEEHGQINWDDVPGIVFQNTFSNFTVF